MNEEEYFDSDDEEYELPDAPAVVFAFTGLVWLGRAWCMLASNWRTWLPIAVLLAVFVALAGKIPFVGFILSMWVGTLLAGGVMFACDAQVRGRDWGVGDLFAGIRYKFKDLTVLSLLLLLFPLVAGLVLTGLVFGGASSPHARAVLSPGNMSAGVLLLVAALIAIWSMMSYHAAPLVVLYDVSPWQAVKKKLFYFRFCKGLRLPEKLGGDFGEQYCVYCGGIFGRIYTVFCTGRCVGSVKPRIGCGYSHPLGGIALSPDRMYRHAVCLFERLCLVCRYLGRWGIGRLNTPNGQKAA